MLIAKSNGLMSICRACSLLGYTKQAWHKSQQNQHRKGQKRAEKANLVLKEVDNIRQELPRLGTRKLNKMLNDAQFSIGRDQLFDLLRRADKLIKPRRKYVRTTDSSHWRRQFKNLVEGYVPTKPEEVLVADITYLHTKEDGVVYAHLVTDAYSKKLMGYEVALDMTAASTEKALKMALSRRQYDHPFIHHSDRGNQYCSKTYTETVFTNAGQVSTTQNGSPYDNAVAERINGIFKQEFGLDGVLKNLQDAQQKMARAAELYNHRRPHYSCHLLTPEQMHQQQTLCCKTYRKDKTQKIHDENLENSNQSPATPP